jgi:hypothetical protein
VQVAQEADGGQPIGPRDGRRGDELLRRLERGTGIRFPGRPGAGVVERPRDGDGPAQERPDPPRQHGAVRVPVVKGEHGPQLEALGVATERHPARRGKATQLAPHGFPRIGRVVRVTRALASHDHDPGRTAGWQALGPSGRVAGAPDRVVAIELEREQGGDPVGDVALQLPRGPLAEHRQAARRPVGPRQCDAERDLPRSGVVRRDGRGAVVRVGRGVDRDRRPPRPLQRDGATQPRRDGRHQALGPGARQRQRLEPALEEA